jgi:hypothetical protein
MKKSLQSNKLRFVMSWQFICHMCSKINKEHKIQAASGPTLKRSSIPLYGVQFGRADSTSRWETVLTHQSGLDKISVDLMRPVFDKGFQPYALSDILVELHIKKYMDDYIKSKKVQYTFMGYNSDVPTRLPDGKGDEFPAVLTHQLGLDKSNIRMTISRARDCYQRNWH